MKLLVAMIMILSASMAFGEEPKTEDAKPKADFPWAVRNAIKDMKKEQTKARLEYEKTVKKAAEGFKKTLEKEMDKATRKADLQLALAIKGEIEKCEVVLKAGEFSDVYDEYVAGEPLEGVEEKEEEHNDDIVKTSVNNITSIVWALGCRPHYRIKFNIDGTGVTTDVNTNEVRYDKMSWSFDEKTKTIKFKFAPDRPMKTGVWNPNTKSFGSGSYKLYIPK